MSQFTYFSTHTWYFECLSAITLTSMETVQCTVRAQMMHSKWSNSRLWNVVHSLSASNILAMFRKGRDHQRIFKFVKMVAKERWYDDSVTNILYETAHTQAQSKTFIFKSGEQSSQQMFGGRQTRCNHHFQSVPNSHVCFETTLTCRNSHTICKYANWSIQFETVLVAIIHTGDKQKKHQSV